jgi:hypothetical protein
MELLAVLAGIAETVHQEARKLRGDRPSDASDR